MDQIPNPPPLPTRKMSVWPFVVAGVVVVFFGLIILGATVAYKSYQHKRAEAKAAFEHMQQTASEERQKMADSIEKGEMPSHQEAIDRVKQELEKSASHMSRDDAAAARALSSFLTDMQVQLRTYEAAAGKMIEAEVLAFASPDRETLAKHRKLVVDFAAANEVLTDTVRKSESLARAALVSAKVPERTIEATMTGFNKGREQRQMQLRIREYDRVLGESALAAIDLLEKTRGKWSRNEASGQLTFQDDATLDTFNGLITKIQETGEAQTKVQQELAAKMRTMGK